MDWGLWGLDVVLRELMLVAAIGFTVGGVDDLLVDGVHLARRLVGRGGRIPLASLAAPSAPGRLAVFVPVWDETAVIGAMLRSALARLDHPDYRVYVGAYPNDPGTIAAVEAVAAVDERVRLVVGPLPGPTTKGDNLNTLWRALVRDDAAEGVATRAVVLHDAEDVPDPAELRVHDALLDAHAAVQLPVVPLIREEAWLVSGVYADEFAEAHAKLLSVRCAVGAGVPLAGVGCAIRCDALRALADLRGGAPFDPHSLTEDYEVGLRLAAMGYATCFARVSRDGALVATRAYFPDTFETAVRQKSRWVVGIALAGWDRLGWARPTALADHWMRMRDRRAPLAMLVLAAGYAAFGLWLLSGAAHWAAGVPETALGPVLVGLLRINAALLVWRLACRVAFTARLYGWREGVRAVPRIVVANVVAVAAMLRGLSRYVAMLRGGATLWEKTAHRFPVAEERVS